MPYLNEYPNIEKIFGLLKKQKQINILLGVEEIENKRVIHHITALRESNNRFILSGLFLERYFSYEIIVKEDGELINPGQCFEPLFISFNMINRIISGEEYISMNDNIYNTCTDEEYLNQLHEGLDYIISLNKPYIIFTKNNEEVTEEVKVYISHYHSIKEDKSIFGISFINSNVSDKAITLYFDKDTKTICYGYLSKFIENNNKKGFFITRDMEEVIEELKNIAVF